MKGFYKDDEITSVTIMEFPGKSFEEEVKKNSPERMRQQGLSVFTEKEKKLAPIKAD